MEEPFYERNFRDYNFSKREFVLAGDSVEYGDCETLETELGVAPDATFIDTFMGCLLRNEPFPYRNRDMAAVELFHAKGMLAPQEEE